MKRHSQILAGTALGLLMASAPLAALPLPEVSGTMPAGARIANAIDGQVILAQAATEETEEERLRREAEEAAGAAEEPAAAEEPPAEEPVAEEPAVEEPAAEEPAAEEPAVEEPAVEEPAPEPEEPVAEEPAIQEAPAEEPAAEEPAVQEAPAEEPAAEEPVTEEPVVEEPAAEEPAAEEPAAEEPAVEEPAAEEPAAEEPAAEEPAAEEPAAVDEPVEDPATAEDPAAPADGEAAEGEPVPENAAPITDSAKEAPAEGTEGEQAAEPAPEDAAPMPESDSAAQAQPIEEVESVTAEEGERIEAGATREERQERRRERRERRDDAEVIEEFNDNRVIIQFNNQIFIESPDYERIIYDSNEVYYEELPRGRVREVIVRSDGSRVITIRNRYGDVVRRSRILPDNREIVLVYVEDRYYDEILEWRDPGADLPPLVLSISREEYILEAELVDDPDRYYAFLDQPPVEQVERTYSLNEVKRSARIRDKVRRVDLDTINFAFGSAELEESEIDELQGVAGAMEQLLAENPGETFLIEGHTDAVGSDLANLALSDQRAESVANALTTVFAIPPENLTTQGYGEQYLKIETEEQERENRRVAIRRITPLVSPVASAE